MAPPSVRPMGKMTSIPSRGSAIGLIAGPAMPNVVAPRLVSDDVGRSEAYATPATRSIERESPTGASSARASAGVSTASRARVTTATRHTKAKRDDRLMDLILFEYLV